MADGVVYYDKFTIDGTTHILDITVEPSLDTEPDKLAVAIQLDGNSVDSPYDVFIDKVEFIRQPICDIQMSQSRYINGDVVIAQTIQVTNTTADQLSIESKFWYDGPEYSATTFGPGGLNGLFVLDGRYDENLGPLTLSPVTSALPRGTYSFNCRILDPVTGETLTEDLNPFEIQ